MAWNLSTGLIKGMLGPDSPNGSLTDLLVNSVIRIYTGSRPADADATESGTLLLEITLDGLTSTTPMTGTNGINLGEFIDNTLKQAAGETWKGEAVATGTAAWGRWYAAAYTLGASTAAVRADGVVSTSGAEINMSNGTSVVSGVDSEVTDVSFSLSGV